VGPAGGNATVDVSGGTLSAGQTRLGSNHGQAASSTGEMNLSGSGVVNTGEFNVGWQEGGSGTQVGRFTVTGGAANVGGELIVGRGTNGRGTLAISGGVVNVSSGANIGREGSGTLLHSGGTLNVNGDWFEIVQANGGSGVLNVSGGTINHNGLQRMILGTRGNATATVSGTGRINAGYLHLGGSYENQVIGVNYSQSAGTVTTNTLQLGGGQATTVVNLEGGHLRFNTLNALAGVSTTFNWGDGSIAPRLYDGGTATGADLSFGTGYSQVRNANTTFISNANITTGKGLNAASRVDLGGIYLSAGSSVFDHLVVNNSTLALTSNSDILEFNDDTVYLLRPFGFSTEDYASLPLITVSGSGTITGTFDTFLGLTDDGRGFSQFTGTFTSASALPVNTWYLQQTASGITFHYKVGGFVPEPGTFGLMMVGAFGLRAMGRLRKIRESMSVPA
jgi:hypothetical protein